MRASMPKANDDFVYFGRRRERFLRGVVCVFVFRVSRVLSRVSGVCPGSPRCLCRLISPARGEVRESETARAARGTKSTSCTMYLHFTSIYPDPALSRA